MRHKEQKEALESIFQKMVNDAAGKYLSSLLEIAEATQVEKREHDCLSFESAEVQAIVKKTDWLYGYESEIREVLESLRTKLEVKLFDKESSHVTIVSCIACYSILTRILNLYSDEATTWDEKFSQCESKKVSESIEILKRHCPEEINVQGFFEARRYIRIWDSSYNW